MRSKTSCFNSTLFKKNLTRFAPVWGLYTLCLILGTLLLYNNGGTAKEFHFANHMMDLGQIMAVINLIYAPITAMLLFGDLFSSRMCYAIHAMPVKREQLLLTNVLSGILFSLVPTFVMTLLAMGLMMGSCFVNAWQIPLYTFAAANLQFICFFGMAVLCVMLSGNRLAAALVYGVMNFGAQIAYWLIDTVYTPMLYGVVTPTRLAYDLTPVVTMCENVLITSEDFSVLHERFQGDWSRATAYFELTENWSYLFLWAVIGIGLMLAALILYRKRSLECAGDAVAFPVLEPVFGVLIAVVTACFAQFFVNNFIGYGYGNIGSQKYLFLCAGLVVGWFAGRMLIERSTRVFQLKNWLGLGALTAVLAVSLILTHFDVLGIVTWQPKLEDIQSVRFGTWYSDNYEFTEEEDIRRIVDIQEEALVERLEDYGPYVEGVNGGWVYNIDSNSAIIARAQTEITDCRFAYRGHIEYQLKSGKIVTRHYNVWADGEAGDTARELLSRWEVVNRRYSYDDNVDRLQMALLSLEELYVDGMDESMLKPDKALVEGLIEAVRKDCDEHNMAQNYYLHNGHFISHDTNDRGEHSKTSAIYFHIAGERHGWSVEIYPDSVHTVDYLRENDLLYYDISEKNLHFN